MADSEREMERRFNEWQQGTPGALDRLLKAVREWLLYRARCAMARDPGLRRREGSSDLKQEVVIALRKALMAPGTFENFEQFRSFILTVFRNELRDLWRKHSMKCRDYRLSKDESELRPQEAPEGNPQHIAMQREIRQLIEKIPEEIHRQVLILHYFERLTFKVIGDRLGVKEHTARITLLPKAERQLRQLLRGLDEED